MALRISVSLAMLVSFAGHSTLLDGRKNGGSYLLSWVSPFWELCKLSVKRSNLTHLHLCQWAIHKTCLRLYLILSLKFPRSIILLPILVRVGDRRISFGSTLALTLPTPSVTSTWKLHEVKVGLRGGWVKCPGWHVFLPMEIVSH